MFERVILKVTQGTLKGQTFVLENENTYILGRSWDCSHRFSDAFNMVSRHHCRIRVSAPLIYIQDLGSLNGTFVNDAKIGQRSKEEPFEEALALQAEQAEHFLWDGDEVRLGCHVFRVEVDPPPPCAAAEARDPEQLWSVCCPACR